MHVTEENKNVSDTEEKKRYLIHEFHAIFWMLGFDIHIQHYNRDAFAIVCEHNLHKVHATFAY